MIYECQEAPGNKGSDKSVATEKKEKCDTHLFLAERNVIFVYHE